VLEVNAALRSLEKRFESDLEAHRRSLTSFPGSNLNGESQGGMGQDQASAPRGPAPPPKPSPWIATLKDRVSRRGMDDKAEDEYEEVEVPLREGQTFLSAEATERISAIHGSVGPIEPSRHSVHSDVERWFPGPRGSVFDHRPFAELCSLSSAARDSAAPHIRQVYEEVFMRPGVNGEVEGPEAAVRGVRVVLHGKAPWMEVVRQNRLGDGWVEGRTHLENGIVSDIARSLDIETTRLCIQSLGLKGTTAEVHVLPDPLMREGARHPLDVARELCVQARSEGSQLRRMLHGEYIQGGDVRDLAPAKKERESVRGSHGDDYSDGRAYNPRGAGSDHERVTVRIEHPDADVEVQGTLRSARKNENGLWVDPGNGRVLGKSPFGGVYGTLHPMPDSGGSGGHGNRIPWVIGGIGALIFFVVLFSLVGPHGLA
jgi:hypothetical protein